MPHCETTLCFQPSATTSPGRGPATLQPKQRHHLPAALSSFAKRSWSLGKKKKKGLWRHPHVENEGSAKSAATLALFSYLYPSSGVNAHVLGRCCSACPLLA